MISVRQVAADPPGRPRASRRGVGRARTAAREGSHAMTPGPAGRGGGGARPAAGGGSHAMTPGPARPPAPGAPAAGTPTAGTPTTGRADLAARLDRIPVVTPTHRRWMGLLGFLFVFDLVD